MNDKDIISILKSLSHPKRLEILRHLNEGACCATLTNNAINISQPNLSQHLKALKGAGLIDCCKVATKRCYYISRPQLVKQLLSLLADDHQAISRSESDIIEEIKRLRGPNLPCK